MKNSGEASGYHRSGDVPVAGRAQARLSIRRDSPCSPAAGTPPLLHAVESVTGPLAPKTLGTTLIHEHILCCSLPLYHHWGERWFQREDVIANAAAQLKRMADRHGVTTIVDGTPLDLARDVRLLSEVSRRSGVAIIASAGFYHYDHFSYTRVPAETLAAYLIEECEHGAEGTSIRPGMLKCAVEELTDTCRHLLRATGLAQAATGLPVFVHTSPRRKNTLESIDLLRAAGADLDKIVVGHCGDSGDIAYVREILRTGCRVEIDRIRRHLPDALAMKADMIADLAADWLDRLLISHDHICHDDRMNNKQAASPDAPAFAHDPDGLCCIHEQVLPRLRSRGMTDVELDRLLQQNPRDVLCQRRTPTPPLETDGAIP